MSTLTFSPFPECDGARIPCVGVISGDTFDELHRVTYLIETDLKGEGRAFEIRYNEHCSPFQEAMRIGDVLAVGHEGHFYLFDSVAMRNLLTLPIEGYFGHLYLDRGLLYVAGCCDLHCVDLSGRIVWRSEWLGIDGVMVEVFEEHQIKGVGEFDPPGGWRPFSLDRLTGRKVDL